MTSSSDRAAAGGSPRPRRPLLLTPTALTAAAGSEDPAERAKAAHATAWLMIRGVREHHEWADEELADRVVKLAAEHGLDLLADLWATSPADSLPGALWRLYALQAWVQQDPHTAAAEFDAGRARAQVDEVIAGVADPPGPDEVVALLEAVLTGVFRGDFAMALERASAFLRAVATGRAERARTHERVQSAARLFTTAEQLHTAAAHWRHGSLQ